MIDAGLSLQPYLDTVCARLIAMKSVLGASLSALRLGVPFQVAQFGMRVEPAVLHGAEVLASYDVGFLLVSSKLNSAHYGAFKALLSLGTGFSLGNTRLAMQIMAPRARLLTLPGNGVVGPAIVLA